MFHPLKYLILVAVTFQGFAAQPITQTGGFNGVSGKQVPPPGIEVPVSERAALATELSILRQEVDRLKSNGPGSLQSELLPDVEVFLDAVRFALDYNEFQRTNELATARVLLKTGLERAAALRNGTAPWTRATGNVVRGYRSKIDNSVQPYGIIVPADWKRSDRARPLWIFLHGRSETQTELGFMSAQSKAGPEFDAGSGFLIRPFGRFCTANKFAGETDLFEVIEHAKKNYGFDSRRIVLTGFSMGGAACWHFASHYAGLWSAASPGAGFAETAAYARVFAPGKEPPPWWEQRLWRWYDATDYAANLANTRLIAYSGEEDPQIQSADIMEKFMAAEGLKLERLIGPKTGHKYESSTKAELQRKLSESVAKEKNAIPSIVTFTTHTLRYNRMEWIELEGLETHWRKAFIRAELAAEKSLTVTSTNISRFSVHLPPGSISQAWIDGQKVPDPASSGRYQKIGGKWKTAASRSGNTLSKTHGLTGPIDDAFLDSFIFVRPTGDSGNSRITAWVTSEMNRAITEWRRVFRGEARVKKDTEINEADIQSANLVLWGDTESNAVLRRILPKLPVRWSKSKLMMGRHTYSAADHAPILIYPNPANPARYVVLNSGFTFREGSAQSNSLQTPRLPDWAIVDLRTAPDSKWPGRIADAGFFDESWKLKNEPPQP